MLSTTDKIIKRLFDIVVSFIGILFTWWIMFLSWLTATIETRSNGLFVQKRVGQEGNLFLVFKIKTMHSSTNSTSTVTTSHDNRITKSGAFFRKTKIDELPQLFNVLFGSMSFVGPRPDVAGFADKLEGEDRIILSIRPGITGPGSLKYKNEEELLSQQSDPEAYNRDVIWKDKVKLNKIYVQNWTLMQDVRYIIKTILG